MQHLTDNKYFHTYHSIIDNAISQNRSKGNGIYYESHHIIPKCIGGDNSDDNLVLLTGKEHFICHHLLTKCSDSQKLNYAFWAMCTMNDKRDVNITSSVYSTMQEHIANKMSNRVISDETRKRMSEAAKLKTTNSFKGKHHTEETKKILSECKTGDKNYFYGKKRPEHSEKMKIIMKGVPKTKEHRDNISKSHNKIYTCPHCDIEGGRLLLRWHFDHCEDNPNNGLPIIHATDPNGNKYSFRSIKNFTTKMKLSRKVLTRIIKGGGGIVDKPIRATNTGEEATNTYGWKFECHQ